MPDLPYGEPGEYLTDRLTDEALEVIDRAGDRPFFLYLAHHAVHTPIEGKPKLVEHYQQKLSSELHHQNASYAAMTHSLDESVGRVLARLDERGLADNTLVIFLSDNGGHVMPFDDRQVTDNAPLRSGKGSLYEGGVRVPLIIRWPGVTTAGDVCDEPVCVMDLLPTIGAAVQPAQGKSWAVPDGISLVPLLNDSAATLDRDALYFHYPHYYPTTTPAAPSGSATGSCWSISRTTTSSSTTFRTTWAKRTTWPRNSPSAPSNCATSCTPGAARSTRRCRPQRPADDGIQVLRVRERRGRAGVGERAAGFPLPFPVLVCAAKAVSLPKRKRS